MHLEKIWAIYAQDYIVHLKFWAIYAENYIMRLKNVGHICPKLYYAFRKFWATYDALHVCMTLTGWQQAATLASEPG